MSMKPPKEWIAEMDADVSPVIDPRARGDIVQRWIDRIQQDAIASHSRSAKVAEFHRLVGQPVLETPQVPADERVRLRLQLLAEEFFEVLNACLRNNAGPDDYGDLPEAEAFTLSAIERCRVRVDICGAAKELADIIYVAEGSFLEFGIDGDEVFDEVSRSNMTKRGSDMRADGKITKGPNYVPPDIAGVLARQKERAR